MSQGRLILVAGATGYVGTRLIPELLRDGHPVRAMARRPGEMRIRPWFERVDAVSADALDPASLAAALRGVDTAYYLIHNMSGGPGYRELEVRAATNFATAARTAGVEQIIYLGGLGEGSHHGHMDSRHKAGEALRGYGPPVTEFRACVIIGTGSISFEMMRTIAHWFPVIPAPVQTDRLAQPISTPDLLRYLIAALDQPAAHDRVVEIGGPDTHYYPDMILECARQLGLRRTKLPLPLYPLELSARLVDRLSPVPLAIARPLMGELVGPSLITDPSAGELFPGIEPMTYPQAVAHALRRDEIPADRPWIDSLITRKPLCRQHVRTLGEGFVIDYHEVLVEAAPPAIRELVSTGPRDKLPAGWAVRQGRQGAWVRLERQDAARGRRFLEVQLRGALLRWAVLDEPHGLPAHLSATVNAPGYDSLRA